MAVEDEDVLSDDVSENVHNRLLGAISHMYKQRRVKAPVRKESSLNVSEFHLTKLGENVKKKGKIQVLDLTKDFSKRAALVKINEQIRSVRTKSKRLLKPLEKTEAEKIQRIVGYENVKKDLNRWAPIVYHQQAAEHVSFPLIEPKMHTHDDPDDFLTTFTVPTDLELALAESLNSSELYRKEKAERLKEKKEKEIVLTLKDMLERRSIMARLRAQLSYKEAKAARQNRIKSKKFHRIQHKDKIKQQIKEFEELQKSDPEAALKKLQQLEKARAQERASLKHRSTGKWAKNVAVRAKYNREARVALSEQLAQSRELTQKLKQDSSSDDGNQSDDEEKETNESNVDNSWLSKDTCSEVQNFYNNYNKFWEEEERKKRDKEDEKKKKEETLRLKGCDSLSEEVNLGGSDNANTTQSNLVNISSKRISNDKSKSSCLENYEKIVNSVSAFNVTYKNLQKKPRKNSVGSIEHKQKLRNVINSEKQVLEFSVSKKFPLKVGSMKNSVTSKKSVRRVLPKGSAWSVSPSKQSIKATRKSEMKSNRKNCTKKSDLKESEIKLVQYSDLDDMFFNVEEKFNAKISDKVNKLRKSVNNEQSNKIRKSVKIVNGKNNNEDDDSYLKIKKQKVQADIDEKLSENISLDIALNAAVYNKVRGFDEKCANLSKDLKDISQKKSSGTIEPNNFFSAKTKHLKSELPTNFANTEDNLDDEEEDELKNDKYMTISEAFACDDVEEEFNQEKEEVIKQSQVEDVNLVLPGWGSWGGSSINSVPKHKTKRFIFKFPEVMPRRDENKGNVVINEDKDINIKQHLVTELPHPFVSVKEYEASIRTPLGSMWMPQSAHRKLITPAVSTKLGTVIEPMTKAQLLKDKDDWK